MGKRKREHREAVVAGKEVPFRSGVERKEEKEDIEERLRGLGLLSVRARLPKMYGGQGKLPKIKENR